MPKLAEKNRCCGCEACYNACLSGAIEMRPDEAGFLYPEVDSQKCKDCGACTKACPVFNKISPKTAMHPEAYLVQHKNEAVRRQSTSGGAFTAIAEEIIKRNGVVFGASFNSDWVVYHTFAETVPDLEKFRNSKYVQSNIGNAYKMAREFLLSDRWVCFSGTPCQINGLMKFLACRYEKLITVDVVCLAIPSPGLFKKYIELRMQSFSSIESIMFRCKEYGYSFPVMELKGTAISGQKLTYRKGSESDEWLRLFLKGYSTRRCCNDCMFQDEEHISDITLWDCNNINDICRELDDNKGTSNVILWTDKGILLFDSIKDSLNKNKVDYETVKQSVKRKNDKQCFTPDAFYHDVNNLSSKDLFSKYVPYTLKIKLLGFGRYISYKIGIYKLLIKIIRKLRK